MSKKNHDNLSIEVIILISHHKLYSYILFENDIMSSMNIFYQTHMVDKDY